MKTKNEVSEAADDGHPGPIKRTLPPDGQRHPNDVTFAAFLGVEPGRQSDPEFYNRLVQEAVGISSLIALKAWARERWPDHYYGREAMQKVWADYLHWKERPAT